MPKDLPVSRESQIEEDMGKAPMEEPIDVPKYLPMLREIRPIDKEGEASTRSSMV